MSKTSLQTLFIITVSLFCFTWCQQLPRQAENQLLVFTAMGCGPYNQRSKEAVRHYIKLENQGESRFIAYLGDLFPGAHGKKLIDEKDKGEKDYREISEILTQNNRKPTFVLPGDNETIDRKDPEIGFQFWHKYFDRFHERFKYSPTVSHQEGRVENFAFVIQDVVVIGIHKVGTHHEMQGPYWEKTLGDGAAWITQNLQQYQDTKSAVIFAHAGIKGIRDDLFKAVGDYGKPVIYIHADGHKWFEKQYKGVPNFHHIQLDLIYSKNLKTGPFYPPVQFTITGNPDQPYFYDRRLMNAAWSDIQSH